MKKINLLTGMAATATVLFGVTACGGNSDKKNMADTMAPDTTVEEIVDTLDAMPAADTALTDTAILIEETAAPEKEKAANAAEVGKLVKLIADKIEEKNKCLL